MPSAPQMFGVTRTDESVSTSGRSALARASASPYARIIAAAISSHPNRWAAHARARLPISAAAAGSASRRSTASAIACGIMRHDRAASSGREVAPRTAIRHHHGDPRGERFGDAHSKALGIGALHQHAARGEQRPFVVIVHGPEPADRLGDLGQQRLDRASVPAFVRPCDDETRARPVAANRHERCRKQIEPFDRMQPAEEGDRFVLRRRARRADAAGRCPRAERRAAPRRWRSAPREDLVIRGPRASSSRGRMEQCGTGEIRALGDPIGDRLEDAMPTQGCRLPHASRRQDVGHGGGASGANAGPSGQIPQTVDVHQVGRLRRFSHGRVQPLGAPVPFRPGQRKIPGADARVRPRLLGTPAAARRHLRSS